MAYELARDCFGSFKHDDPSPEQAKKNVEMMRKAAFSFTRNNNKRQKANNVNDGPAVASGANKSKKRDAPAAEQQCAAQRARRLDDKKPEPKKKPEPPKSKVSPMPTKPKIELDAKAIRGNEGSPKVAENKMAEQAAPTAVTVTPKPACSQQPVIKELPEIGPGWKLNMVLRKSGERYDYYYFSPTGERFRSLKEAKASADNERAAQDDDHGVLSSGQVSSAASDQESSSDEGSISGDGILIGAVGYKFRKNFTDESGEDLGRYDGEVVDILSGTGKSYIPANPPYS